MLGIQNTQCRDAGAVDLKIQRLFEIAKLPMPLPHHDGADNAAQGKLGDGQATNDSHFNVKVVLASELDLEFEKHMVLDCASKDPSHASEGDDSSTFQPSTPDQLTA
jgi:hypothetical protein